MKKAQPKLDTYNLKKSRQSPIEIASTNQNCMSELEGAKKKYQDIVENVEDMVFEMDTIGRIQYVSPNIEKILGYKPEDIIGEIPTKFMPPDEAREKYAKILELAAKHKKIKSLEMTYFHKNGSLVILETSAVPFFSKDGTLLGYRGVNRDTTERRRAEESLRRFELIAEHSRDIILFMRRDNGQLTQINAAAEKAYGYSREELLKLSIHDLRAPETQALTADQMAEADIEGILFETIHRRKDGSAFPVEVSSQGSTIGGVRMLISVVRDITDRKHFEEKLRKSEENYRKIFEGATEGIYQTTMEGRYLNVNPAFARMFGFSSPQEMIDSVTDIGQQLYVDPQTRLRLVQILTANDKAEGFEAEVYRKDKSKFWISINIHTVRNADGRILFFEGTNIDISERKRAERELEESQQDLKHAQAVSHTGSWRLNIHRNELHWSDEAYRIFDIPKGTPLGYEKFLSFVHPEDREHVDQKWMAALRGDGYDIEHRIIVADKTKWVHERAELEFDDKGNLLGGFGTVQDITDRKQMEKALRDREERFRSAFDKGAVPMVMTALDGRLIMVNSAYSRMLGYSESELSGVNFYDITHPDDIPANKVGIDAVVRGEKDSFRMEKRYIRKDGLIVWVDMSTSSVRDESNKPLYIVTYAQDITERKRAEEALRESEIRYRMLVDSAPFAIGIHRKEKILYANKVALQLCGAENLEQLQKKSMFDLIHPAYHEPVADRMRRLESGQSLSEEAEFELIRLDMRVVPVEVVAGMAIQYEGGPAIQVTFRDITERKQMEVVMQKAKDDLEVKVRERTAQLSEINKSLLAEIAERKRTETELRSAQKNLRAMASEIVFADERSRQQFATDLHDTVVQTLGAAKLRAQLIRDQLSGNAKPILSELENLLTGAIVQARTIMAEMSPPVLNELGLKSALEWLTEQTSSQYGICGNFENRSRPFVLMSREIEILLFQATRELLMNVVKHSKAQNATVKFSCRGQKVRIEVADDGTGFDTKKTFQPDLKGGYGLYSIRERLRHIGGQLSIKSKPGQGTIIIVSAPREIEK